MNSKIKYIPLVVIGAILLSLMAVGPVFSADSGTILIVATDEVDDDATDDDDALSWANQGELDGSSVVVIEVVDDDLNESPLKTTEAITYSAGLTGRIVTKQIPEADRPLAGSDIDGAGLASDNSNVIPIAVLSAITGTYQVQVNSTTTETAVISYKGAKTDYTRIPDLWDHDGEDGTDEVQRVDAAGQAVWIQLVTVESNDDEIEVQLKETGKDTGIFRANVTLIEQGTKAAADDEAEANADAEAHNADPENADNQVAVPGTPTMDALARLMNPLEVASDNDEVEATYDDQDPDDSVDYSVDIESTSPVVASHSPAHGTVEESTRPDFEVEITDADSGVDDDAIWLVVARVDSDDDVDFVYTVDLKLDDIDEGQEARTSIRPSDFIADAAEGDLTYYWWYIAKDTASNVGVTDRVITDDDGNPDGCAAAEFAAAAAGGKLNDAYDDMAASAVLDELRDGRYNGCDGYSYTVDVTDPELVSARSGGWWDTDIDDDDKTNEDPNDADDSSILVVFSEDLDPATVQASDFEVDDNEPLSAEVFSGNQAHVFLRVPQLDPDDEPEVKLVDSVSDLAGRRTRTGQIDEGDTDDGIAPTLEVTIAGTGSGEGRPVTDDKVTITVSANEKVSRPTYRYWRITNVSESGGYYPSKGQSAVIPFKQGNTYEVEVKLPDQGLYSILVTAGDSNNKETTAKVGVDHAEVMDDLETEDVVEMRTAFEDVEDALLIEVDKNVAGSSEGMVLDPAKSATNDDANTFESDNPNLFISIDLSAEGSEYPINDGTRTPPAAQETSDQDSYNALTVTSATLDGDDIASMLIPNTAGNVFLYKASGLSLGDHEVVVEATDAAGNEDEFKGTITIVERKPYSLSLSPGWNLVSIPGDPANTDINAVIPADHPASRVHSYDPMVPGLWLTAIRGADGSFSGTLTDITAGRAYLIETDSSAPVSIDIPRADATSVPPVIVLSEGWNMVPVLDPAGVANDDDQRSASDYLGADVKVSRIYGYSSISGSLLEVDATDGMLDVGAGYWVYVTEEAAITP